MTGYGSVLLAAPGEQRSRATNSARRLDRLEEDLRQRRRAEFGSDFDPDEIDSVATFSSIDLALKDTKN